MDSKAVCCYCEKPIRWLSVPNASGYWVHDVPHSNGFIFCEGKNTRAEREHYQIGDPPFTPMGNDGIDAPVVYGQDVSEISLRSRDDSGPREVKAATLVNVVLDRQKATQTLYDSGLLWLINASILWPRGYALTATMENGRVLDLFVQGDGMEPWAAALTGGEGEGHSGKFKTYESDGAYRRFCEFERQREMHPPVEISGYIEGSVFRVGDRVRLVLGPWKGKLATVLGRSGLATYTVEIKIDGDDPMLPIIANDNSIELA